jgi:SNF2 family DNA or RNA helicase
MSRLAQALEGEGPGNEWGGAPYVRIDGSSDGHDRRLAVNRFRDDPGIHVALLSVTAAGTFLLHSSP